MLRRKRERERRDGGEIFGGEDWRGKRREKWGERRGEEEREEGINV